MSSSPSPKTNSRENRQLNQHAMKFIKNLHRGRIARLPYVLAQALTLVAILSVATLMNGAQTSPSVSIFLSLVLLGMVLLVGYLSLCLTIRRLHDIGNSGWRILLTLIPVFGLFYTIYIICRKGQATENTYGPALDKQLSFVVTVFNLQR